MPSWRSVRQTGPPSPGTTNWGCSPVRPTTRNGVHSRSELPKSLSLPFLVVPCLSRLVPVCHGPQTPRTVHNGLAEVRRLLLPPTARRPRIRDLSAGRGLDPKPPVSLKPTDDQLAELIRRVDGNGYVPRLAVLLTEIGVRMQLDLRDQKAANWDRIVEAYAEILDLMS